MKYIKINNKWRFLITGIAVVLILVHGIWPKVFIIDQITLLLIVVAIIPFLLPFIRKAELPGGIKFEFKKQIGKVEEKAAQLKFSVHKPKLKNHKLNSDISYGLSKRFDIKTYLNKPFEIGSYNALQYLREEIVVELKDVAIHLGLIENGENKRIRFSDLLNILEKTGFLDLNQRLAFEQLDLLMTQALQKKRLKGTEARRVIITAIDILDTLPKRTMKD